MCSRLPFHRLPAAVLGLVLGGVVAPAGAEDEAAGESPAPRGVPPSAIVGESAPRGTIGELPVLASAIDGGWELRVDNPTSADRELDVHVECLETRVIPIARMLPRPRTVAREIVSLRVPAGGAVTHRIRRPEAPENGTAPAAQANGAPSPMLEPRITFDLVLREIAATEEAQSSAPILAQLRIAGAPDDA